MKFIGLLMVADEDDVLERTLWHNAEFVDHFYALDGSTAGDQSRRICISHPKCGGYITDAESGYVGKPRDGWRQALLETAYRDHGHDHWFLLLHGDEVWTTDPRDIVGQEDGYVVNLPFFFPRQGEPWQDDVHPLDQLHWSLGPGWPELRMFRGGPNVHYAPSQHFNVTPRGLDWITAINDAPILHYPYRAPELQRSRAARHQETGFDPDNYHHIINGDHVYWTEDMIAERTQSRWFTELRDMVPA